LIPDPVEPELLESTPDRKWLERVTDASPEAVIFVVPGLPQHSGWDFRDALSRWMRVASVVRQDNAEAIFAFFCDENSAQTVRELAAACNLSSSTRVLGSQWRAKGIASADVVICDHEHASGGFALEAMARGRALLAADVEAHREATSNGRGCLWFRPAEVGDIAFRARFLASNAQFRCALGAAGREHCAATRSCEVVAAQYDAVYRTAFGKRKDSDASPPKAHLVPLQVGG
jgi:glycosyltransferase involved in cell wall biosynthesis